MNEASEFVLERFTDESENRILFPNHLICIGVTMSGKSSLIGSILDRIHKVYNFKNISNTDKLLIIISPISSLEITQFMTTSLSWNILLFQSKHFDAKLMAEIKLLFEASKCGIKILLVDDFLIRISNCSKSISLLNEAFSYYRHLGVSIFSTMHCYDGNYQTILQNSGLVLVMYGLGTVTFLRNLLQVHFHRGTAHIVRMLKTCFLNEMRLHDYICVNQTKEAMAGELFYITNTCFDPDKFPKFIVKLKKILFY